MLVKLWLTGLYVVLYIRIMGKMPLDFSRVGGLPVSQDFISVLWKTEYVDLIDFSLPVGSQEAESQHHNQHLRRD